MNATDAVELFGGREVLAENILRKLKNNPIYDKLLNSNMSALESVSRLTVQELLDELSISGIPLDEAMTLTWDPAVKQRWKAAMMNSAKPIAAASSQGLDCPEDLLVEIYVRLQALDAICAAPPSQSSEQVAELAKLRAKYQLLLSE